MNQVAQDKNGATGHAHVGFEDLGKELEFNTKRSGLSQRDWGGGQRTEDKAGILSDGSELCVGPGMIRVASLPDPMQQQDHCHGALSVLAQVFSLS